MNITYGVSSMLGAALGGAMADHLGWRWEFGVQVPILVSCLVVAILTIPSDLGLAGKSGQTLREAMRAFDFMGSLLMSTSVAFLVLGLVSLSVRFTTYELLLTSQNLGGNVLPWNHPFVIASLVIFALCFPLFLFVETRAVKPIMPLRFLLKSPHMNLISANHIAAFLSHATIFNV